MLRFLRNIFTIFTLLLLQSYAFAQTPVPTPPESSQQPKSVSETIHFGDLIDVDVVGSFEFDWRGTITPEGFLKGIDFVEEPIFGLCQTEETLARQIEKAYAKLLRDPKVVVRILDRSGRPVSVLYGAVRTPQRFQIQRPVRLNELIILSGGVTERASGEIQIFRPQYLSCEAVKDLDTNKASGGSESLSQKSERFVATTSGEKSSESSITLKIKIMDLLAGKPDANPLIMTGDIITVLEAAPVYVIGGVANPQQISSRTQTTVSRAIAAAGGLIKGADSSKITIFRRSGQENKIIEVDLDAIKAEKAEDLALQPYDIVDVQQKGKDRRKFPPILKNIGESEKNALILPLRIVN